LLLLSVDCDDALVVAQSWSAALDRPIDPNSPATSQQIAKAEHRDTSGWHPGDGPTWLFAKVPEPKNREEPCTRRSGRPDREGEVARLVELGARRVGDIEEWAYQWTVLRDPEGNEILRVQAR
jgi:hypothetical protein